MCPRYHSNCCVFDKGLPSIITVSLSVNDQGMSVTERRVTLAGKTRKRQRNNCLCALKVLHLKVQNLPQELSQSLHGECVLLGVAC